MARPNVILILTDQHRWDCVGYAGNPDVRTPNLDALATHGVNFSQALCQYPLGAPSRSSLLTGQYASTHGVLDNGQDLPETAETLPKLLHRAAYTTGCVGKMLFHPRRTDHGFDAMHLAGQDGLDRGEDEYHKWLAERGVVDELEAWEHGDRKKAPKQYWDSFGAQPSNLPEAFHSTTWIGNTAVRFLQSTREPFFLMMSFVKPHHPFDPPAPWHSLYNPASLALPGGWRLPVSEDDARQGGLFNPCAMTEARFRQVLAYYYASISHLDQQVGRLLATLTSRGFTNNVFVFCADHGDCMGQHGLVGKGPARCYDALLRVPLVVAGLAGQRHGKLESAPAQLIDVMPTILDAVGLDIPPSVEGRSLVPLLLHAKEPLRTEAYCEGPGGVRIVRGRRYKLIEAPGNDPRAFYDLKKDPHEFDNLYGDPKTAAKQAELTRALQLIETRSARRSALDRAAQQREMQ